tara:strand:+ start:184 stop:342 length:159 start_codon:yes stop_codon:yes gene_type:complete
MTTSLLQVYLMESLRPNRATGKGDVGFHARRERRRQGGGGQTFFKRSGDCCF